MKKLFLFASISLLVFASFSTAQMSPREYNDAIVDEQDKIAGVFLKMVDYFQTDLDKADLYREAAILQASRSIETTKKFPDYEGNTQFRDAAVTLFVFYKDILEKAFKETIVILKKGDKITETDLQRLDVINNDVTARETVIDQAFGVAQEEFAKKYNLRLDENKLQEKIDEINK